MKKLIITTTAFIIGAIATAQVSENRTVSNFSKIEASQGVQVYFTQSNSQSVRVETDDNEKMQYIKTDNNGKTLKIYIDSKGKKLSYGRNVDKSKKKWRIHNNNIRFEVVKVYVSVPKVTDLKVSSGASIVLEEPNFTHSIVLEKINELLQQPDIMQSMSKQTVQFATPDAAARIAEELFNLSH